MAPAVTLPKSKSVCEKTALGASFWALDERAGATSVEASKRQARETLRVRPPCPSEARKGRQALQPCGPICENGSLGIRCCITFSATKQRPRRSESERALIRCCHTARRNW